MSSLGFQSRGFRLGLGRLTVSRGLGPLEAEEELVEPPEDLPSPTIQQSDANRSSPRVVSVAKERRG